MESLIAVALAFLGATLPSSNAAQKPNIILVMADDQGWGDMAYNGHSILKTPNFDAMAREAVRFDRFYAAAPVCTPTRGSVLTGRHPNRFGCFSWGHTLRPQEITLAEALKTAGYRTGHFGKWHVGSVRAGSPVNPGASGFDEWISAPNFFDLDPVMSVKGKAVPYQGDSSSVTVDTALDFIRESASSDQPFFAVVWFGSPHLPHRALEQDRNLYPDQPENLQNFYGEITEMDRAFGKLRNALKTLDLRDNTILWYCSDNGALPNVGSTGGKRGRKGDIYEGGLLVPSLLEWPSKIKEPKAIASRCNTSDIYPTLLNIAGVQMENQPRLDGISLLKRLEGNDGARPEPMGFWEYPIAGVRTPSVDWMAELLDAQSQGREPDDTGKLRLNAGDLSKEYSESTWPGHAAWIDGDWKLHRIANQNGEAIRLELYNLADDSTESENLVDSESNRARQMRKNLEEWLRSVTQSLNGADY